MIELIDDTILNLLIVIFPQLIYYTHCDGREVLV